MDGVGLPSISESGLGQDEPRPGGIVIELLAELADEDAKVLRL
jgi:hypothetical protein